MKKFSVEDAMIQTPVTLITTIGIPTANRPEALKRCIGSLLSNMREHARNVRIVVTDDSKDISMQHANEACLIEAKNINPDVDFYYASHKEKAAFVNTLIGSSDLDRDIVEFALLNPLNIAHPAGANRNALFLQTVSECFLSIDDDVLCELSPYPKTTDAFEVTSQYDPTHVALFRDRKTLLSEHRAQSSDLLGLHESILGKTLTEISKEKSTYNPVSNLISFKNNEKVRVSWTGFYGDSGAESPGYYIWRNTEVRDQLTEKAHSYNSLALSREIFRAPKQLMLGNGGYCQSTVLAFDNRENLPPFFPVQRGYDIIFGKTLTKYCMSSLIGYLPWALLHAPVEQRLNKKGDIVNSGRPTRLNQILSVITDHLPKPVHFDNTPNSFVQFGKQLFDLGSLSPCLFEDILISQLTANIERDIIYLKHHLDTCTHIAEDWSIDIREIIDVLIQKKNTDVLRKSIRISGTEDLTVVDRIALVQQLVLKFGKLMMAWPSILSATRELKQYNTQIARSVGDDSACVHSKIYG